MRTKVFGIEPAGTLLNPKTVAKKSLEVFMIFTAGSALLDAVVLSVVSQGGTYGYKITQDVRKIMDVSESTLYPVLRRLQKDGCLETYDMEFQGRNRRYYKITSNGMIVLDNYRNEWRNFSNNVNGILMGN